jgi:hypothetical protein
MEIFPAVVMRSSNEACPNAAVLMNAAEIMNKM